MMLATTKTHLCVSCHQWPARYLRHLQPLRPHKDHFFIAGRTRPYSRHIYEAEDARQRGPSDIRLICPFNKTSFCERNWGFPFVVSSRSCSCKVYLMVLMVMRNRSCGTLVSVLKNTFRSPRQRSRPDLLVPYTTGQCVCMVLWTVLLSKYLQRHSSCGHRSSHTVGEAINENTHTERKGRMEHWVMKRFFSFTPQTDKRLLVQICVKLFLIAFSCSSCPLFNNFFFRRRLSCAFIYISLSPCSAGRSPSEEIRINNSREIKWQSRTWQGKQLPHAETIATTSYLLSHLQQLSKHWQHLDCYTLPIINPTLVCFVPGELHLGVGSLAEWSGVITLLGHLERSTKMRVDLHVSGGRLAEACGQTCILWLIP